MSLLGGNARTCKKSHTFFSLYDLPISPTSKINGFRTTMEVASDEPPVILDQRTRLSILRLNFQISPIEDIDSVQGDRVVSEKVRDL